MWDNSKQARRRAMENDQLRFVSVEMAKSIDLEEVDSVNLLMTAYREGVVLLAYSQEHMVHKGLLQIVEDVRLGYYEAVLTVRGRKFVDGIMNRYRTGDYGC